MAKGRAAPKGTIGLYRVMDELFRTDSNMPVAQAVIFLFIAARSADPASAPTMTDIAVALSTDVSRVSRNVKLLCEAGLVETQRDPLDPRSKLSFVTAQGHAFLTRLTTLID
jgi:DNA-binding MarR family transcriptional regulator